MSAVVPFTGLGPAPTGDNPATGHLGRVSTFKRAMIGRQAALDDYIAAATHTHDLQKDMITHASREERRNQTHAAKVKGDLVASLRASGVDAASPGRTRVKAGDLEFETIRPKPSKSKAPKTPQTSTTPTAPAPASPAAPAPVTPAKRTPRAPAVTFKSP